MATYEEIQENVFRNVIDAPTAVQNAVPTLVNQALRSIQIKHNFKVMETLSGPNVTTEATRVLLASPSDFKEVRGNPYYVTFNSGRVKPIYYAANRVAVQEYWPPDADGYPANLLQSEPDDNGSFNFEVWPLPDGLSDWTDGEYRVYIPYWRFLAAFEEGSDSNWFSNNAELWLEYYATAKGFSIDWDEERAAYYTQLAQTELVEVMQRDKKLKASTTSTLVPHRMGVNTPSLVVK